MLRYWIESNEERSIWERVWLWMPLMRKKAFRKARTGLHGWFGVPSDMTLCALSVSNKRYVVAGTARCIDKQMEGRMLKAEATRR